MPTILVVDDDPDIRDIATIKLEQAGLHVITESDGEGGLAAALEQTPDVLLLVRACGKIPRPLRLRSSS
jgi:DNA-binding response OmpR family regulator